MSTRSRPLIRLAAVAGLALVTLSVGTGGGAARADWQDDAVAVVNAYRAMSGLAPVTSSPVWEAEARLHSCYMLANGLTHTEIPGAPGYTAGGQLAGANGNVAVSGSPTATARSFVDLWMTGPFHAIGVLRPALRQVGYGGCVDPAAPAGWASGATLDVLRGLDPAVPAPTAPIVFPGDGAVVALDRFVAESPNPVELCGWTGAAGLPLIVMFPSPVDDATAELHGPNGPLEACVLTADDVDGTAQSILSGANAVIVVPRSPLAAGTQYVTVTAGSASVNWSFTVDPAAAVGAPVAPVAEDTTPTGPPARFVSIAPARLVDTRAHLGAERLVPGVVTEVAVASPSAVAVSANFVAVAPDGPGYLTLYGCAGARPTVSSVGFGPGEVVANEAIVPVVDGKICVYSNVATDLVVDVNGYFEADATAGFVPIVPHRVYDSRSDIALSAGTSRRIEVAGDTVPAEATAVVLGATVVGPATAGHLSVTPCQPGAGRQVSSINYRAGEVRPNAVVVPLDDNGGFCVESFSETDVVVDVTGYFAENGGAEFVPLAPIRLADTRLPAGVLNPATDAGRLGDGQLLRVQVAGARGIPADATGAAVNVTAVDAAGPTYLTVYPCGERPQASSVNLAPGAPATGAAAFARLSPDGALCVYTKAAVHVVVDISGVWR